MRVRFDLDVPDTWAGMTRYQLERHLARNTRLREQTVRQFVDLVIRAVEKRGAPADETPTGAITEGPLDE